MLPQHTIFGPLCCIPVQAAEAQVAVVEGERRRLSEHVEELKLKVTTVGAALEEARRDLEREREDSRGRSREVKDMQQEVDKWRADASKAEVGLTPDLGTEWGSGDLSSMLAPINLKALN